MRLTEIDPLGVRLRLLYFEEVLQGAPMSSPFRDVLGSGR